MCGVYQIRNLVTDMIYIGSSATLNTRRQQHFNKLKNNNHPNSHLQHSYNKHGKDSFVFEILYVCDKDESLLDVEQTFIDLHEESLGWDGLYNMAKHTTSPMLNRNHTSATKEKISKSNKGKGHNEEWRLKMSEIKTGTKSKLKGKDHPNYGSKRSEETKKKQSIAKKGKSLTQEHKENIGKSRRKTVHQFTKSMIYLKTYNSVESAHKSTSINKFNIARCARGEAKSAGGYVWSYNIDVTL